MRPILVKFVLKLIDILWAPIFAISAAILKFYRRIGSHRMPMSTRVLRNVGIFPIRDHYYEPKFNFGDLKVRGDNPRKLPGLNLNIPGQLSLIKELNFSDEFQQFLKSQKALKSELRFEMNKGAFKSGDAEFLYSYIRKLKPKRIIEIGCGNTTKLLLAAAAKNFEETGDICRHTCIEPFEKPWLNELGNIELVRKKVEDLDYEWSETLGENDLLFIDSSHIIRPGGDVLTEFLEIIPTLAKGVHIHVHDVFTPYEYLDDWLDNRVYFWNEQYLLEALLSHNPRYRVQASLNYLAINHFDDLKVVCPFLTPDRRPGSFYFSVNN